MWSCIWSSIRQPIGNRFCWFSFFFPVSISFPEKSLLISFSCLKTLQAVLAWRKFNLSDRLTLAITWFNIIPVVKFWVRFFSYCDRLIIACAKIKPPVPLQSWPVSIESCKFIAMIGHIRNPLTIFMFWCSPAKISFSRKQILKLLSLSSSSQ